MDKNNSFNFYADYHFINAECVKEPYKSEVYPIILMQVVIRVSKPRKPHSIIRSVEKSRRAHTGHGSFTAVMEEVERNMKSMKSKFKIHLPAEMKKKAQKAENEGKKVLILLPPGKGAPVLLSKEAQEFIDSKQKAS